MDDSTHPRPYRAPRRVATAPIPLRAAMSIGSPDSDSLVETLYNHPNAKIISFTASGRALSRSPGGPDDEPGSLSWSSQLERTIAVGPFRIYRAPGSVAFLNCGSALQPILPKSQCWCIDEVNSKFVLQIRRPNYWRIELPVQDPEDQTRAEALRGVFDKILQFEKTECPFKRSFTVDLPERPQTPVTRRPWTPVQRSLPGTPAFDTLSSVGSRRSSFVGRATTPTPLSNRHYPDFSTSPLSRPTSSASCAPAYPQLQVPKSRSRAHTDSVQSSDDFHTSISGDASDPKPLDAVLERPAELDSSDPFQPSSCPSFSSEAYTNSSDGGSPQFSATSVSDEPSVYELHEGSGYRGGRMKARLRRTAGFTMSRLVTLPPHLMLGTNKSSPSENITPSSKEPGHPEAPSSNPDTSDKANKQPTVENDDKVEPQHRRRDSEESFHSVESWHSSTAPPPLSPLTSQPDSPVEEIHEGREEQKTTTLLSPLLEADKALESASSSGMPCAWESDSDEEDNVSAASNPAPTASDGDSSIDALPGHANGESTPPSHFQRPAARHRATTSSISVRRRPLSPLPSAANLFTPPTVSTTERRTYKSRLETVKNLPMAIISKTCEMIIGPPSHLITLMLKVAAKIVAGQWSGLVFGYGDDGEQIPVQWDYSEGDFSDWSDDEPHIGSHHDHHGHHRHHGHHGHRRHSSHAMHTHDKEETATAEQPESSDDSRSWGVD
ncbi:uncharacterized protein NECHADRAFT_37505 [Fusarium vanettenii 77-13-4]|uniref:Inheritance of peroxisomes protein 1 n=1 Tax=Fusarium vanettenii (strain ATCC MYA-4622 / CBS 123669 / FGSC 9596 / NRRL 45880 / 77-13-4) TaxID=660122 RepID=C7ZLT6_FUSV7|nr:uncharacterized protein NECHADRAFT_37505 [Fusarium vanettenii 77-13-4]EEU35016.1 hypothetical protein NECHADRAFT_37505 [Fusarium vanettenii 77-13-4]